ncbi:MAG: hypothetical protein IRZ33_07005 [Alicyclobacillaceae bacterium]|nr:hypothetical protein [Alicyclobacillaceae bacterium]
MKRAAGYAAAFLAGAVLAGGSAMAATTYVQAQLGQSVFQLNGQVVGKAPKLVYGGTTYVQLYSIQQALKKAGIQATWNGSKNPGVFNMTTTGAGHAGSGGSTPPASTQTGITFTNLVCRDDGLGDAEVDGIAVNHDKVEHTALLIVSFFDQSGKLIGTGNGAINNLGAGQSVAFQTISQVPYTSVASFKVQVQTLL